VPHLSTVIGVRTMTKTCSPRRFRDHMDPVSVSVMQHGLTPAVLSGSAAIKFCRGLCWWCLQLPIRES
jgi:hypothetical protein